MFHVTALLPFLALAQSGTTADLRRFEDGVGVPFGKNLSYENLRQEGKTHVRFVVRFKAHYPGNHAPPVFSVDMAPVMREIREAHSAGLGVIIATEATAQENRALFYRNIEVDGNGRVDVRDDGDFRRFDKGYQQVATALRTVDPRKVMWEILPEPGWAFRDTGAADIAQNAGRGRASQQEIHRQLGSHAAQRRLATRVLHRFEDHVVPLIRRIWPEGTLMLGTPGYGSPTGPGVYQDCIPNRFENTVFHLHSYGPREISHQGDKTGRMKGFTWPEPNWKSKVRNLTQQQVNNIAYEFDNRPWTAAGLADMLDEVKAWQRQFPGAEIHFAEFGCTARARNTEAGQNYIRDMRRLMDQRGFGRSEWLG